MDKIKVMGFHYPHLYLFSLMTHHTQTTPPNFTSYTSKMHKGCRNNYIEAFGAVHWVKKAVSKKILELQHPPFGGCRLKRHYILYYMCTHCVYQTKDCVLKMVDLFLYQYGKYYILWGQQIRVKFNVRWALTNITIIKILWLSFKLQNISKAITLLVRHDVEAQCAYLIRFDNPFFLW